VKEMAQAGLRVLAMAEGETKDMEGNPCQGLTLVGWVGLLDPARVQLLDSIATCQRAGIDVIMVTGINRSLPRRLPRRWR
jgi:Ca2+-transporting ATPase